MTTIGHLIDSGVISRKTEVIGDLAITADGKIAGDGSWLYGVINRGTPKVSCGRVSVYTTGTGCLPIDSLYSTPDGALALVPEAYRGIA